MCGIAGIISPSGDKVEQFVTDAKSSLRRRGPDAQHHHLSEVSGQVIGLTHTRLSIIDPEMRSNQPMDSSCGRYTIIFNGMIYNYETLRLQLTAAGNTFDTCSDTEVLLKSWMYWGIDCLEKISGMYAFAVVDRHTQTITICRDNFGIKPLFYYHEPSLMLFGSDPTSFKNVLGYKFLPDKEVSFNFLVHNIYDIKKYSFFLIFINFYRVKCLHSIWSTTHIQ